MKTIPCIYLNPHTVFILLSIIGAEEYAIQKNNKRYNKKKDIESLTLLNMSISVIKYESKKKYTINQKCDM